VSSAEVHATIKNAAEIARITTGSGVSSSAPTSASGLIPVRRAARNHAIEQRQRMRYIRLHATQKVV
jgi:hypothetical protein